MIIHGKFGTYTVMWRRGSSRAYAELVLFRGDSIFSRFLGIFKTRKKPSWITSGRAPRLYAEAMKMTPEQMTNWFWEAVIEYEQHILAWNTKSLLASA